jgi:serine/threonine protein kinase
MFKGSIITQEGARSRSESGDLEIDLSKPIAEGVEGMVFPAFFKGNSAVAKLFKKPVSEEEAKLASLNSTADPSLVLAVYHREGQRTCQVMEYRGIDLVEYMTRELNEPDLTTQANRFLTISLQLTTALNQYHMISEVLGDIKPDNITVIEDDHKSIQKVSLIDIKTVAPDTTRTPHTPGYRPTHLPHHANFYSDRYALAVILAFLAYPETINNIQQSILAHKGKIPAEFMTVRILEMKYFETHWQKFLVELAQTLLKDKLCIHPLESYIKSLSDSLKLLNGVTEAVASSFAAAEGTAQGGAGSGAGSDAENKAPLRPFEDATTAVVSPKKRVKENPPETAGASV